ncbi:DUF2892 domain-containing protein [Shimia sp. R10_1]|uniref:YgaP family membrane protein n=1 Tax=Shimia sp. R10_1 TaxID=2821095 RepID=UPI001ADC72D7|nr:DUF2892 domain-containing protein [Shimia sp. R10_1]MBO9475681.1 DUF2892 domain-containing protein [Shimia sp. R10_1]
MMKNMGMIDRGGRLIIAAALVYMALVAGVIGGVLFWIALAVAAVFTLTAFVGNCPLYRIVGLKTCRDC